MRAISIIQPWADLIVYGFKDVENRDWYREYRGPVLIHASKSKIAPRMLDLARKQFEIHRIMIGGEPVISFDDLCMNARQGAIIGVAEITDWSKEMIWETAWHQVGVHGIYLSNQKRFTTAIPYKGQLGIFDIPDEIVEHELKMLG